MPRALNISLFAVALAYLGCQKEPSPAPEANDSVAPAEPGAKLEAGRAIAKAGAGGGVSDPCQALSAADFEAVGLSQGKPNRLSNMADGGCTWNPALGNGGFLHFEFLTYNSYEDRKKRAGEKATSLTGVGDEAWLLKGLAGHAIYVKHDGKYFRIDGNAKLTPEKLEPLARAAIARL